MLSETNIERLFSGKFEVLGSHMTHISYDTVTAPLIFRDKHTIDPVDVLSYFLVPTAPAHSCAIELEMARVGKKIEWNGQFDQSPNKRKIL